LEIGKSTGVGCNDGDSVNLEKLGAKLTPVYTPPSTMSYVTCHISGTALNVTQRRKVWWWFVCEQMRLVDIASVIKRKKILNLGRTRPSEER